MLTQPEQNLIFSLTTKEKAEILENQAQLFSDLLGRLNSIEEGATATFLVWILPNIEVVKDFIYMADSLEEATGALKCWAFAKDWEFERDVRWDELARTLWDG